MAETVPAGPYGRPPKPGAKRRDPNIESSTLLLNKVSKHRAQAILRRLKYEKVSEMDLSDVVNLLLTQWCQQQEALMPVLREKPNVVRLREVE